MKKIVIDVNEELVSLQLGRTYLTLHGQWIHLYLALALRVVLVEKASAFLSARELQLIRPWFNKQPGSVGKEVARHLQGLVEAGLDGLIVADGRTKRWRLAVLPKEILLLPSQDACVVWLDEQKMDIADANQELPGTLVEWLTHTTSALIMLVRGRIEDGLDLIRLAKAEHSGSALLGGITELVELRLASRVKQYPDFGPYLNSLKSDIGRALLVRAELTQNLAPTPHPADLEAAISAVRGIATRSQGLPDINGLGATHNVLGVLLRRNRRFKEAEMCLRYAAVLLVASFDLLTLQAALFNLGHTLAQVAKTDKALREALQLIDLDRDIYKQLGIGGDSAQAEIVAGTIYLRLNDLEGAKRWLDEGRQIVRTLKSDYDRGGIEELYARLLWSQWWQQDQSPKLDKSKTRTVVEAYERAQGYLSTAGDLPLYLKAEIKSVTRGEPPPWLESGWKWRP
jgi:tetratricopeptide (TPR) repeat protein